MDRIGGFTVILATLCSPGSSHGPAAPSHFIPRPRRATVDPAAPCSDGSLDRRRARRSVSINSPPRDSTAPPRSARCAAARLRGGRTVRPRSRLAKSRAAGADRPRLSDQPRHRLAALRRSAADRGRCPGQRLGGRSTAHAGQGPLGADAHARRRLYPARRRRSGFQ